MTDPFRNNLARPQRYWYVDGLAEMAGGGVIFLIGLCYTIAGLLPPGPARGLVLGIGQPLLVLTAAWFSQRTVRTLKERLTYPRTGYVEYRRPAGSKRWARVFLLGFVSFSVAALTALLGRDLPDRFWPLFTGLMLALAIAYLGARIGLKRFFAVALFSLLLGGAVFYLNPPNPWSAALVFGLEGLAWTASGVLTLRQYLRDTHPLDAEDGDE